MENGCKWLGGVRRHPRIHKCELQANAFHFCFYQGLGILNDLIYLIVEYSPVGIFTAK
jgi:hypothetical protein